MWCPRRGFSSRFGRAVAALRRDAGAEHAPLAHVAERHRTQVKVDLMAQLFPEVVRQAAAAVAAAADRSAGLAADRLDPFLDREDNVGDAGVVAVVREQIAAARTAHAVDQTTAPQLGEKLFEIGERDLLPP